MKNITTLLVITITIFAFSFSGCEKNPFKPGEDNDEHPIVWQYKYDIHKTGSNVIPAMDENGNIYFSIQNGERQKDVYIFANDKDGNAFWDKHYSSTNYVDISRVMYIDNKVVYTVAVYDELYGYKESIYCLNATNGTEIWQYSPNFETKKIITTMAATSEYLVVGAKWGGEYPNISELHYLSLSDGSLVKSIDFGDDEVQFISIVENDIYLGVLSVAQGHYAAQVHKMNLESNITNWVYQPEYPDEDAYIFKQRSLAIDANGRVICVIGSSSSPQPATIYVISNNGTLANTVPIPMQNSGMVYDFVIDNDNNFYTAILDFAKYTPDGNQIWEFYSGTTVPNSNFRTGSILGDNGVVYHAENGGILNVNTIGEIEWAKYDETNFTKPGYPLLTNDGNMIVVGDLFVTCVKGDGAKIQNAPWPRVFCNNGNTSSR